MHVHPDTSGAHFGKHLGAVAFGVTLLLASLLLGGKDTGHGDAGHAGHGPAHGDASFGWAPVTSLRFWVFMFAFGGGAGLALTALGSSEVVTACGAVSIGWASGAIAVTIIRGLSKSSVSSSLSGIELVGTSGTVTLPIGPGRPGKVRVEIKGRAEDYVAHTDDESELPSGSAVLIVGEGERGSLLVAKAEMM